MRYLFYSHDGFGLGHTRRHLAIARALTEMEPNASVLLACGSEEAHRFGLPPHVEVLKLPALRKVRNEHYVSRRLHIPPEEVQALRSELLCTAVKSYRPSVVLVDKHPFGACGEFRAALHVARDIGCRTVLGLRDILDEPEVVEREWENVREEIPNFFDLALIYGERKVFDPVTLYAFAPALAGRTRFCGYVLNEPESGSPLPEVVKRVNSHPLVVATTGGGEDGFVLLENFLRASIGAPWHAFVVAGPMTPEPQYFALQVLADQANATLHRFVPNLPHLFRSAEALVCMGGYNTLTEAAAADVPTICVPRVTPRREQAMRAEAFERLGLLQTIQPGELNPERLAASVRKAVDRRELSFNSDRLMLRFDGASHAAQYLRDLPRTRVSGSSVLAGLAL
jgi:predicted glycosyltransferase